jgi:hypothetical protein
MKKKKILLLLLSLLMSIATTTVNAGDISSYNSGGYGKELRETKYTLTNDSGNTLKVYKGMVYEDEKLDEHNEKEIKHILKNKETGRYVNVNKGIIDSKEKIESDIEIITPLATSKPTRIEWDNFTSDWSGTVNFTYTKYAFPSGDFVAWADEPFSVIVYDYDYDTSFPRVHAVYTNGRYEVETGAGNFTYYCTLSNKNKDIPMSNAIYKSIPYDWHNN